MGTLETLVARLPGAVLAVDEDLRVLAMNPDAEEALGISASKVLGRPCYEAMSAIDLDTGAPCHQHCPLARDSVRPGWAFNRMIEASWTDGKPTRLDCFLLKTMVSTTQLGHFCFLGPYSTSKIEAHFRNLQAIESVHLSVSSRTDLKEVAGASLRAVLSATSANAAELFFLHPESGEPFLVDTQRQPAILRRETNQPVIGEELLGLIARSEKPLLAVGAWEETSSAESPGWYISVPLAVSGRTLGALGIASQRHEFDVASAVRILFSIAAQLSLHLRGALYSGDSSRYTLDEGSSEVVSHLRIRCLGSFTLFMDGEPIPMERFQRLKAVTLLKYLVAHNGGPVSREALMEVLWPGGDPARASGNLRVVLHALRRALEPELGKGQTSSFVMSHGDLVYLNPSARVWIDADEFVQRAQHAARLASEGRLEDALQEGHRAAALYRGDYLQDEPYSDWCLFERVRLKEVYIDLLRRMASIMALQSDVGGAIDAYRAALVVDYAREEVHRELMQLLWQAGRRSEALRQHDDCQRALREQVGVEPTEETESLYREILAGAVDRT